MADWALDFAGGAMVCPLVGASSGDTFEIDFHTDLDRVANTWQTVVDSRSGGGTTSYILIRNNNLIDLAGFSLVEVVDGGVATTITDLEPFVGSAMEHMAGKTLRVTLSSSNTSMTVMCRYTLNECISGQVTQIRHNSLSAWDPDSSDRSGSTNQPILTDTIGGNDATGVNFPAFDPDVWVFVGTPSTSKPWWLFQEED